MRRWNRRRSRRRPVALLRAAPPNMNWCSCRWTALATGHERNGRGYRWDAAGSGRPAGVDAGGALDGEEPEERPSALGPGGATAGGCDGEAADDVAGPRRRGSDAGRLRILAAMARRTLPL